MLGYPGPVTHRQYRTWTRYWELELWAPRREDYYQAQVAYEVARSSAKHPGKLKRQMFLNPIPFSDRKSEKARNARPTVSKHRIELAKGAWMARVQVAGGRPAAKGKDKGKKTAPAPTSPSPSPRKDARGKRFEVERRVAEPEDTNGGERA